MIRPQAVVSNTLIAFAAASTILLGAVNHHYYPCGACCCCSCHEVSPAGLDKPLGLLPAASQDPSNCLLRAQYVCEHLPNGTCCC